MKAAGCGCGLFAGAIVMVVALVMIAGGGASAKQVNAGAPGGLNSGIVPAWAVAPLQQAAQTCPEVTAPLLAAQIEQESGWNTTATSPVGATGLSQFMPATWSSVGVDANGDGTADPTDPADAIASQAVYMCDLVAQVKNAGLNGDVLTLALASYNAGFGAVTQYSGVPPYPETQTYVRKIRGLIGKYATSGDQIGTGGNGTTTAVLDAARSQLGVPYAWGGGELNGPSEGMPPDLGVIGFDCSSLVRYAYYQATRGQVTLPRVSAAQYAATADQPVPTDQLAPGDLLFYGDSPEGVHHVAIYAGGGKMLEAQQSGTTIHVTPIRTGGDFLAATRVL